MEFIFQPSASTTKVMCIYKMSFDDKEYYIGGTCDLCDRISRHKKCIRRKSHTKLVNDAAEKSTVVKFEILEFLNDRKKIKEREEFHLVRNIGLPMCLNQHPYSTNGSKKKEVTTRIVKFNERGRQVGVYTSIIDAAQSLGINYYAVSYNLEGRSKTTGGDGFYFRRLDKNGEIISPPNTNKRKQKHARRTIKYNLNWVEIASFRTVTEAALDIGLDRGVIRDSIVGISKKPVKGLYYYRYADNSLNIKKERQKYQRNKSQINVAL